VYQTAPFVRNDGSRAKSITARLDKVTDQLALTLTMRLFDYPPA